MQSNNKLLWRLFGNLAFLLYGFYLAILLFFLVSVLEGLGGGGELEPPAPAAERLEALNDAVFNGEDAADDGAEGDGGDLEPNQEPNQQEEPEPNQGWNQEELDVEQEEQNGDGGDLEPNQEPNQQEEPEPNQGRNQEEEPEPEGLNQEEGLEQQPLQQFRQHLRQNDTLWFQNLERYLAGNEDDARVNRNWIREQRSNYRNPERGRMSNTRRQALREHGLVV
jgi:hypothetical protein